MQPRLRHSLSLVQSHKLRRVGAVEVIDERTERPLLDKLPVGNIGDGLFHGAFVFLWFKAAGAVNQCSARLQQRGNAPDNRSLKLSQLIEAPGLESPAYIDTALHHPGICTRHIYQNSVEWGRLLNLLRQARFGPIVLHRFYNRETESRS